MIEVDTIEKKYKLFVIIKNIIVPVETSIGTINAYVYIANQTYVVDGLLPNKKYFDSIISWYTLKWIIYWFRISITSSGS